MGGRGGGSGMSGSALSKVTKWGRNGTGGLSNAEANKMLKLAGIDALSNDVTADIRQSGNKIRVKINDRQREVNVVSMSSSELYIDELFVQNKGAGEGTKILNEIKSNAKKNGYTKLSAYAAGDPTEGTYNGYYSLARFGFDAPIPQSLTGKVKQSGFKASTIQDLMKTQSGRNWWKNNGVGFAGEMRI